MSLRTVAKIGFALALIFVADFSASFSYGQYGHGVRRRIGRIAIMVPRLVPFAPFGPHMRFGPRAPYDYYGERRAAPNMRSQLPPNEIVSSLQGRGFRDISAPQHRGSTYILEATGPLGERVRLIVNAVTGGIDGVRVIETGRPRF
jgi:hypothetical protein